MTFLCPPNGALPLAKAMLVVIVLLNVLQVKIVLVVAILLFMVYGQCIVGAKGSSQNIIGGDGSDQCNVFRQCNINEDGSDECNAVGDGEDYSSD